MKENNKKEEKKQALVQSLESQYRTLMEKKQTIGTIEAALTNAEGIISDTRLAMDKSFGRYQKDWGLIVRGSGLASAGLLCLGLNISMGTLPLGLIYGGGLGWLGYQNLSYEKNNNCIRSLLQSRFKSAEEHLSTLPPAMAAHSLLKQFNKEATAAFHLEHAAHMYHKKGGASRKGRKALEKALSSMDVRPAQAQTLRDRYNSKDFPAPGTFINKLEEHLAVLRAALDDEILRELKSLPPAKPALPPVPDLP